MPPGKKPDNAPPTEKKVGTKRKASSMSRRRRRRDDDGSDSWHESDGESAPIAGAASATRAPRARRRAAPTSFVAQDNNDSDDDDPRYASTSRRRQPTTTTTTSPPPILNSDDSSDDSSYLGSSSSDTAKHRHKRAKTSRTRLLPGRCAELADLAAAKIFARVEPKVRDLTQVYRSSMWESAAEHFLIHCFSTKPFNCVSLTIKRDCLYFTANTRDGFNAQGFAAYKAARRNDGWRVHLDISKDVTNCFRHGFGATGSAKILHAEIQQFMSIANFEQLQFGPNKLCCFYCASILLAWQEAGEASHWDLYSHGAVYDYTLPHLLFSRGKLGKTYFGADVHNELLRANDVSRDRFENELHDAIKRRVKGSGFSGRRRTRVGHPRPPPTYASYQRDYGLVSSNTSHRLSGGGLARRKSSQTDNNHLRRSSD